MCSNVEVASLIILPKCFICWIVIQHDNALHIKTRWLNLLAETRVDFFLLQDKLALFELITNIQGLSIKIVWYILNYYISNWVPMLIRQHIWKFISVVRRTYIHPELLFKYFSINASSYGLFFIFDTKLWTNKQVLFGCT